MRWVAAAMHRPNRCAVVPFVGSHDPEGFIDTGVTLPGWDPHVYVSVKAVREMGRMIGLVPAGDGRAHERELAARDAEIARLRAVNESLSETVAAIDVIESEGFTARKKRGPKAKAGVS